MWTRKISIRWWLKQDRKRNHFVAACAPSSFIASSLQPNASPQFSRAARLSSSTVIAHPLNRILWEHSCSACCCYGSGMQRRRSLPRVSHHLKMWQQDTRFLAHVTGHKKQPKKTKTKKNTKKNDNSSSDNKPISTTRTALQRQRRKNNTDDPSTRPDYPLGPNYVPPTNTVIVPPARLLPTASPHVFVAKAALETIRMDPFQLFGESAVQRHHATDRPYSFQVYNTPRATTTAATSNSHQHHHHFTAEVAFLGRSNVGKSSLINALMRQSLATTSKQPGRTQQAYYYAWVPRTFSPRSMLDAPQQQKQHSMTKHSKTTSNTATAAAAVGFLVDLPGYGYAVGSDTAVQSWQAATQTVLLQRRDAGTLRRVFLLQDSRLTAPQSIDQDVQDWLEEAEIPYTIVLTKADDSKTTASSTPTTTGGESNNRNSVGGGGQTVAGVIKHVNLCCLRFQQLWTEAGRLSSPQTASADENDEEGKEDFEQGKIMMSPAIHVTSAKKKTGLAELLLSIETEFLAARQDSAS